MTKFRSHCVAAALVILAVPMMAYPALAKHKKLTYEQAWAACKIDVDKNLAKDAHGARYSRGAACMHKYGYRL
jgi:hypothetical protein